MEGMGMGLFFSGEETRTTVTRNFNRVRKLFRLSTPKLTELIQPIAPIPFSKFRRLMGGERDITAEELNALYELLAVPPTTFTFPWAIQDTSFIKRLTRQDTKLRNPVFDHVGTPIYPYELSGKENWLPAQLVGEALSSSKCLFDLDRYAYLDKTADAMRDYLAATLQTKIREYTKSLFPDEQYEKTFEALYNRYPANKDKSLTVSDISQFLTYFGHALLEYMRKEATLNFYKQLEENTQNSIFLRCYNDHSFSQAYNLWIHGDYPIGTLFQLVNYAGRVDFEIILRIETSSGRLHSAPDKITLLAQNKKDGHIIASIVIPFDYQEWFRCPKPTEIKMSGILGKDINPSTDTVTVWEGKLWEELYGQGTGYRRFSYLYPILIEN